MNANRENVAGFRGGWARGGAIAVLVLGAGSAAAQCPPQWVPQVGISGGTTPVIFSMVLWDPDGEGPAPEVLVAAGEFTTAGTTTVNNIATWDGSAWSALDGGMNAGVNSLAVLASGELVAAGSFTVAGSTPANYIATWNGTSWSALGTGMNNEVNSVVVMPNGDLIAGGFFNTAGGLTVNRVARWDGSAWSAMSTGMNNIVWTLAVMSEGDLVAGGSFTTAGGKLVNRIARWNGTAWSALGGANSNVFSLATAPNGDLYAGGQFTFIGTTPASRVARWNGTSWSPMSTGILGNVWGFAFPSNGDVIACGLFVFPASQITRWDGSVWNDIGGGTDAGVFQVMVQPNDDLLAGGMFTAAGGTPAAGLALWTTPVAPTVSSPPQDLNGCPYSAATFTVGATGTGPLTYAWRKDGVVLSDGAGGGGGGGAGTISGATTDTLTIAPPVPGVLSLADAGVYDCVVSNTCDAATSAGATLTICPADYDCNTFVNGDDFDAFVQAFVYGEPAADIDGNEFVNGDDFDFYVERFVAGC